MYRKNFYSPCIYSIKMKLIRRYSYINHIFTLFKFSWLMFGKINKHSELCPTRGWKFVYALQSPKKVVSRIYEMVSRDTAIPYRLTAFSSCIISISISTYSFTSVEKQFVKVFSTFIDCIYNRYIHLLYPIKKEIAGDKAILRHIY